MPAPGSLSVLTYNVLHRFGASRLLAGRAAVAGATWPQERQLRIAETVRGLRPDVACLQEVDNEAQADIARALGEEYSCATWMRNEGLAPKDGCVVFVRAGRFEVVETQQLRLRDAIERHCSGIAAASAERESVGMTGAFWRELREKLTMALFVRLRPIGGASRDVCVATSHLYWDPRFPDLKLLQAFLLARELENFARDKASPSVLAGDFNSTQFSEGGGGLSGVYELLTRGFVPATHEHHPVSLRRTRGILAGVSAADIPDLRLSLPFRSAYADAQGGIEGPITNASPDFQGCLDYIMYRGLDMRRVRPLPTPEELRPHLPLPSADYPSDHLPLWAEFALPTPEHATSETMAEAG